MLPANDPEVLRRFHGELDLVRILVSQLLRQFAGFADPDDLRSHGQEGLLQAARTFDPSRGVPFRRWANVRVRGYLLDAIRRSGRLPRRLYARVRALEAANHIGEATDERDAAAPGTATTPAEADGKLSERLGDYATAMAAALLRARNIDDEAVHVAAQTPSPEEAAAHEELAERVRQAIAKKDDPDRTLLLRMYWHGDTLEEAGAVVGLSRSWACRVHARAITSLGKQLRGAVGPR